MAWIILFVFLWGACAQNLTNATNSTNATLEVVTLEEVPYELHSKVIDCSLDLYFKTNYTQEGI
jgi:hypothetical protein